MADESGGSGGNKNSVLRLLFYILVGFVVWFAFVRGRVAPLIGQGPEPRLVNQTANVQADFDWSLIDRDGNPVSLAEFRGKPVFLNVWATWCPPCRAEIPSIDRLAEKFKDTDARILCVSIDDAADKAFFFADSNRMKGQVLWSSPDSLPSAYDQGAIPSTYIIDRAGKLRVAETGSAAWDHPRVVALLQTLLDEPAPSAPTDNQPAPEPDPEPEPAESES